MNKKSNETPQIGAQLVVRVLEAQGVTHVFGIPAPRSTQSSTLWSIPRFRQWFVDMNRMQPLSPAA